MPRTTRTSPATLTVLALGVAMSAMFAALAGCGTADHRRSHAMLDAYLSHDHTLAVELARERARRDRGGDRVGRHQLRWSLEEGALWRAMGEYGASDDAFQHADRLLELIDASPVVSISDQAGATMTNLAALPYEGYAYDRIMVSTFQALNALKLGDKEVARVELNRVLDRQRQAVERNERRIEAAEEEASEQQREGRVDMDAARGRVQGAIERPEIRHAELYQAQGDYINPFSEWLQGIYFLFAGDTSAARETARHALQRVTAIAGAYNDFVAADLELAEAIAAGDATPALTYVIFETGRAPSREQERIDIPLLIRGIDYIGAAFPVLVFHHDHERHLSIEHAGGRDRTQLVADMDTIVALEFENHLPMVITRTIAAAAAQAAAHYGVHRATQGDDVLNIAARIGSSVYRAAQAQADRRTWTTLPKQFQYARIPTPEDRRLTLRTASGRTASVTIEEGQVNVVYVKSVRTGSPLNVAQFRLR